MKVIPLSEVKHLLNSWKEEMRDMTLDMKGAIRNRDYTEAANLQSRIDCLDYAIEELQRLQTFHTKSVDES